jgi:hypothetical protein
MLTSASALKLVRQIHLYISVFIAPAILFFALTGALQTFGLHETAQGSDGKPPAWIVTLTQIHKHETATVPVRKPRPASDNPRADKQNRSTDALADASKSAQAPAATDSPATPAIPAILSPKPPAPVQKSHLPMKIFFLLVALGLFASTLTGSYMTCMYNRGKIVITGLFLAGIIVPLILLRF